jgi:hypothetical protein
MAIWQSNDPFQGESNQTSRINPPQPAQQDSGNPVWSVLKNIGKEAVAIPAQTVGGLAHSLYTGASGLEGMLEGGVAALQGKDGLQQAADTINQLKANEPHLIDKYTPRSQILDYISQHIIDPVVQADIEHSTYPNLAKGGWEALGEIAKLFPLHPTTGEGLSIAGKNVGKALGESSSVVGNAIKTGVGEATGAVGDLASGVSKQSGFSSFVSGLKKAFIPKNEAEVASKMMKPVDRLGGIPKKFRGSDISREVYLKKEALATDEMLQQAHQNGVSPTEYAKNINIKKELANIDANKASLFNEYNSALQDSAAGGKVVSVDPLIDYLKKQLEERVNHTNNLVPFIQKRIRTLENVQENFGDYTLSQAQKQIQSFNTRFDPTKATQRQFQMAGLLDGENTILRDTLDSSVTGLPDTLTYQGLKDRYSALRQHQDLIARAVQSQVMRDNLPKGTFLDYIAGIEGMHGIWTMNPHTFATAAAAEATAWWRRTARNADRAIQDMYKTRSQRFSPRDFYSGIRDSQYGLNPNDIPPMTKPGVEPKGLGGP